MLSNKFFKPSYYMQSLNFHFQIPKDTYFSKLYKDHFHKSWINLRHVTPMFKLQDSLIKAKKV